MFNYLIAIHPLGLMYGSAGGFLSPENLVGRSQAKFPPDAATLAGLILGSNKEQQFAEDADLKSNLYVAGAFWANNDNIRDFYVPIPWTKIIGQDNTDEWVIQDGKLQLKRDSPDLKPDYSWQKISAWQQPPPTIKQNRAIAETPWRFVPMLHPKIQKDQRRVEPEDGLFLENAVQLDDETCLVYLSTHAIPDGWYRFGGENHLVEVESVELSESHPIVSLLQQPISRSFALISPGVWGSNRLSQRHPTHAEVPQPQWMLTDKAMPFRFRSGGRGANEAGRLGRGRYAVKPGSTYILEHSLDRNWWDFPDEWFPQEGFSLKHLGCGLCLPLDIEGVN